MSAEQINVTTASADRAARAALSAVTEPGDERIALRIRDVGADVTWRAVLGGDDVLDRSRVLQRRAEHVEGAEILERADHAGIRYLCPGEPGWPVPLDDMAATLDYGERVPPPLGLWLYGDGDLVALTESAVAMVGSRACTRYGARVASDLATDLALAGRTVISGAAYGIDAAAHRGALGVGGPTIAVLACGVDVPYPRTHAQLLERIAADGLIVSEVPPGSRPMRAWFLARNRIIAAMSAGTIVVEAALRSGALSTATWTQKLSRETLVVPGPITSALSAGCHTLVRDGAGTLVTSVADVLEAIGRLGEHMPPDPERESRPIDDLLPAHAMVREFMHADAVDTVAGLAASTGLPAHTVAIVLRELAVAGWVTREDGGWRLGSTISPLETRT
ncbi:DNA-processing protein DprA [Jiangella sp. DSM 45060]|uniref:DNA-processing protein DprA n=1 Tax=Jiangella sp. DSM 45060 TaxID=1798224 RepID=UPI00087D2497|nr:DNA-processing protein DprA [Jiangella sp. DSM 45060]SDS66184.1 DNA processing protein [Jiangella sp. DSM 45060]